MNLNESENYRVGEQCSRQQDKCDSLRWWWSARAKEQRDAQGGGGVSEGTMVRTGTIREGSLIDVKTPGASVLGQENG